ncbi:MAG: histidinol-phosphate transaminase [Bdellovibrionales bacterium]
MRVAPEILSLRPYQPGKPISETKRELGLSTVVKLASNESPLGPSPRVVEALRQALPEIHRYPDGSCFEMRHALSQHFGVPGDQLVFGNGSDELVDILVQIYCEPGDGVLTSKGAFSAYSISAQSVRARTVQTELTADSRFDLKAMALKLEEDPLIRLVFLPNPNNPTGTYFTSSEFESFMRVAGAKDIFVVMDEAYVEFVRAKDYPNGMEFRKRYSNLLLLRTMSKVHGLAGLRIGVLIAPVEVCGLMNRIRKPFNVNSLAQVAVVAALQDHEYVKRLCQITWEGLDYFYRSLDELGLSYLPSQGNFVLFNTSRNGEEFFQALLRKGIILRPVTSYGFPQYLRMSVGLPEENRAAIAAIREVLATPGGKA